MIVNKYILYVGPPSVLLTTRKMMLDRARFPFRWTETIKEAVQLLGEQPFPLVIFGELLTASDVLPLAEIIRQRSPETRLLSTGGEAVREFVDGYLEPQAPPDAFLRLAGSLLMQAHGHPEISGKYVAWVDSDRRYTWVSDGFCQLLGYIREDLLGKTIEEITYPGTSEVAAQFEEFRNAGQQQGEFMLQHQDGSAVPVHFTAQVLPDGCMVSVLEPAANQNT